MAIIESMVGEGMTVEYIERCMCAVEDAGDEVVEARLHGSDWGRVHFGVASYSYAPGLLYIAGVPVRVDPSVPKGELVLLTSHHGEVASDLLFCPGCRQPLEKTASGEQCARCGFQHSFYFTDEPPPLPEPDRSAPVYHYDPELGF